MDVCINVTYSPDDGGWYCEIYYARTGKRIEEYDGDVFETRDETKADAKKWISEKDDLNLVLINMIEVEAGEES